MARVESVFSLVDRMSGGLERIRALASRTERQIDSLGRSVTRLQIRLDELDRKRAEAHVGLDMSEFWRDYAAATAALNRLDGYNASANMGGRRYGGRRGSAIGSAGRGMMGLASRSMMEGGAAAAGGGAEALMSAGTSSMTNTAARGAAGFAGASMMGGVGMVGAIIALVTPAMGLINSLIAGIGTLLPMIGALGAGFAVMAGVAIPAIMGVVKGWQEVKSAEDALKQARTPEEIAEATEKLRIAQEKLSPVQKGIISGVRQLATAWRQVTQGLTQRFLETSVKLLNGIAVALKSIAPLVRMFADIMLDAYEATAAWFGSAKGIEYLRNVLTPLLGVLRNILPVFANLAILLGYVMAAAAPLANIILKGLNSRLEGLVKTMENGGLEKLSKWFESWAPTLSSLWDLLAGVVTWLFEMGEAAKPWMPGFIDGIKVIAKVFADFIRVVGPPLLAVFVALTKAISWLDKQLGPIGLGGALVWLISPITAVVGWLMRAWNESEKFRNIAGEVGSALKSAFEGIASVVERVWSGIETVVDRMRDAYDWGQKIIGMIPGVDTDKEKADREKSRRARSVEEWEALSRNPFRVKAFRDAVRDKVPNALAANADGVGLTVNFNGDVTSLDEARRMLQIATEEAAKAGEKKTGKAGKP